MYTACVEKELRTRPCRWADCLLILGFFGCVVFPIYTLAIYVEPVNNTSRMLHRALDTVLIVVIAAYRDPRLHRLLSTSRLDVANRNTPINWSHNAGPIQNPRHQDLFRYLCFEPLLLHGLQAHFLVNLFEPLLHVLEPLEFR
jgi:hypothetical protein